MHLPSGKIYKSLSEEDVDRIEREEGGKMVPISREQMLNMEPMSGVKRKNWMRNQECPCGSKKKFKKCCWSKYE